MRWTWKSAIWKQLADSLWYNFIDLDKYIEEKNNIILSDFIEKNGWEIFREEEHNCLKNILCSSTFWKEIIGDFKKWNIISLWWWTIIFERNREVINSQKNNKLIYLNTSLENISTRILKDEKSWEKRNSLTWKNVLEELKEVFEERKNIYENNCDFEVDNNWTIEDTILEIKRKINYWWICVPVTHPLTPSLLRRWNIEEWDYCLDKNCLRKEIIYKKKWKKYFSRIRDNYFSKKDLKEKLSEFEIDKLKKMWIILR
jgi:shikimate kinase